MTVSRITRNTATTTNQRLLALLPGVASLRGYQRGWLRGDTLAGITVAAYLVPQVMAYAQIAGLPPAVGLLAVVAPTLAYAVLGSSRQLSVGPESTTALMTGRRDRNSSSGFDGSSTAPFPPMPTT